MKTLIGVVLGLVVGVVVVAILQAFLSIDMFWPAIVVGVLVGLVARKVDSAGGASYLRGALAALATIAAMGAGQFAAAQITQQMGPTVSPRGAVAAAEVEADVTATDGDAAAGPTPVTVPTVKTGPVGPIETLQSTSPSDASPLDIVFLVIGCVLAYEVGKGSNPPTTDQEADADAEGEAAAADPGEEPATGEDAE